MKPLSHAARDRHRRGAEWVAHGHDCALRGVGADAHSPHERRRGKRERVRESGERRLRSRQLPWRRAKASRY